MNKLDLPITVQRVDHGIQRVSYDSVTSLRASVLQNLPR